jgi:hypothetical protein
MKTAVEWQFEQMFNSFEKFNNGECTFNDYLKRNLEIREQALKMEKERIIYAHVAGHNAPSSTIKNWDAEQYYNETFKQQEPNISEWNGPYAH